MCLVGFCECIGEGGFLGGVKGWMLNLHLLHLPRVKLFSLERIRCRDDALWLSIRHCFKCDNI